MKPRPISRNSLTRSAQRKPKELFDGRGLVPEEDLGHNRRLRQFARRLWKVDSDAGRQQDAAQFDAGVLADDPLDEILQEERNVDLLQTPETSCDHPWAVLKGTMRTGLWYWPPSRSRMMASSSAALSSASRQTAQRGRRRSSMTIIAVWHDLSSSRAAGAA